MRISTLAKTERSLLILKIHATIPLVIVNMYLHTLTSDTSPDATGHAPTERRRLNVRDVRSYILKDLIRILRENTDSLFIVCGDFNIDLETDLGKTQIYQFLIILAY